MSAARVNDVGLTSCQEECFDRPLHGDNLISFDSYGHDIYDIYIGMAVVSDAQYIFGGA